MRSDKVTAMCGLSYPAFFVLKEVLTMLKDKSIQFFIYADIITITPLRYGEPQNYDLCLNTTVLGINGGAEMILHYLQCLEEVF